MKTYKANKKGYITYLMIGVAVLPTIIFMLDPVSMLQAPWVMLPVLLPALLVAWAYFDTFYKIENDQLLYKSAFLEGKIDIASIREITKGRTQWIGVRPALAEKGLIIKFSRFNQIYIAPENNEELIRDLLKINAAINVTE